MTEQSKNYTLKPYSFDFFCLAGEASGDLHGANLIHSLKKNNPSLSFVGVGGKKMKAEGLVSISDIDVFKVMGFTDVLKSYPSLRREFFKISSFILETPPKSVILIDYPGFNLRLAKELRKKGYQGKIIHYICPSVWAWKKKRINQMSRDLDLLICLYPFEASYFSHTSLSTKYFGNPLTDSISNYPYKKDWWKKFWKKTPQQLIALFPGSRNKEIASNLPTQLKALELLYKNDISSPLAISYTEPHHLEQIKQILNQTSLSSLIQTPIAFISSKYNYELMKQAHLALATSGTVTLELALHHTPTIATYHISTINRWLAKYLFRISLPFYCIVNLLAKKEVFPEWISKTLNPKLIYQDILSLYSEESKRSLCLESCKSIWILLKGENIHQNIAKAIEKEVEVDLERKIKSL